MADPIVEKLERAASLIKPGKRDKSWEWCHQAFLAVRDKNKYSEEYSEMEKDYLCLHLFFYLANWGVYRGSSFLLQRDYKAHLKAVEEILDPIYDLLWDYVPDDKNIEIAYLLLFDRHEGIYWRVKNAYITDDGREDVASDTLTTKILLGTFGCVPAFDRLLKAGIRKYKEDNNKAKFGNHAITQIIECKGKNNCFKALANFALENSKSLQYQSENGIIYPPMKCVDMFFWQIGYDEDVGSES